MNNTPPKRRWYQFSLSILLGLTVVVCMFLGVVAVWWRSTRELEQQYEKNKQEIDEQFEAVKTLIP